MKKYHKIETLFKFDKEIKGFRNEFYNENVELLRNNHWLFTEKIDGMNFRIYWDGHKLQYGGRTKNTQFSKMQIEYIEKHLVNDDIEMLFEQEFKEIEVYVFGELYGNKVQNGGLYTDGNGLSFKVFDVEIDGVTLTMENAMDVAKKLGYDFVPFVFAGTVQAGIDYVLQTETSTFSKAKLEGLVGKPIGDFRDRLGNRIVIKIKRRDLLKTEGL